MMRFDNEVLSATVGDEKAFGPGTDLGCGPRPPWWRPLARWLWNRRFGARLAAWKAS